MASKHFLRNLQREMHGKKDIVSSLILLLVGAYLYGKEINYLDFEIPYFSLMVLVLGVLLFLRSLSK